MLVRLLLAGLCLTTVAAAQHSIVAPSATGLQVRLVALDRAIRHAPGATSRVAIADASADRSLDPNVPLDVLRWTILLPSMDPPTVTLKVGSWKPAPQASASYAPDVVVIGQPGMIAGQPATTLTISPWKVEGGKVFIAADATIDIAFTGRMRPSTQVLAIPSYMPRLANQGFEPTRRPKPVESSLGDIPPSSWYDAARPYLKLQTSRDGIAAVAGERILALESRFANVPVDELVLWHKGSAVHMDVADADGSGTFTTADTLWWQGQRPAGDSTWFSTWDTTATFFLSTAPQGTAPRLSPWPTDQGGRPLDRLWLSRHVEYDTGHYHLGDADDPDAGVFNADVVPGEGFYWMTLNANGYQRQRHTEVLTPHADGTLTASVSYFTVNDPPPDQEHRFDVSLDGGETTSLVSSGYAPQVLTMQRASADVGAGPISIKLFATGIDSLRKYRDYQSEAVVDHITINAPVHPMLHQGALDAALPAASGAVRVNLSGMRSSRYVALDATNHRIARRTAVTRSTLWRGGIAPVDLEWPTVAVNPDLRRVALMIDDVAFTWDTTSGFAGLARSPNGEYTSMASMSGDQFAQWLRDRPSGSVVMAAGTTVQSTASLRNALAANGVAEPPTTWIAAFVAGSPASAKLAQGNGLRASMVHRWDATEGKLFADALVAANDTSDVRLIVHDLQAVEFVEPSRPSLSNLALRAIPQTDVIYITHRIHRSEAERLAAHRRAWNGVTTSIFDIDDILDEYGSGSHSAYAVRAFLRDVWDRAPLPKPKYLVLFGNASWDVRLAVKGGNVGARRPDQIPTYGRPSADYWYGLLDDPNDKAFPELMVGRIPALTAEESRNHVSKIIAHDTTSFAPWMRKFFFIGGGSEQEGLCSIYQNLLEDPFGTGYTLTELPFCVDTVSLCNYPTRPNLGFIIRKTLNDGVEWMNFIGHGATDRFDILGWDPNELDNAGRTGFMATYACQTGAYSNPSTPCKNAQYLTEPDRGLVGAVGGTGWTWKVTVDNLHYRFHDAMRSEGLRNFGDIVYRGKTILAANGNQDGINTAMQQSLLGDPLSRVRIDTITDAFVRRQDVEIVDRSGSMQLTEDDSLIVLRIRVRNAGIGTSLPVAVRVKRTFDGATDSTEAILEDGLCSEGMVRCTLRVKDMVGDHAINLTIDPDRLLVDDPRPNNVLQFVVGIFTNALLPIEPQAHWTIPTTNAVVRMIDPNPASVPTFAEFVLARDRDTSDASIVVRSQPSDVRRDGSVIDWTVGVELPASTDLWLGSRRRELGSSRVTSIDWIPVRTGSAPVAATRSIVMCAARHQPLDASVVYDSATQVMRLLRRNVQIFMRSSGIQTRDLLREPILQIHIGAIPWVDNPYFRGMNVVVLGPLDTVPKAIRRYDTWQDPIPANEGPHNGYSHEFIAFMRDSIADGDRVLIATCDEAFTGFEKDTTLDSLRTIMRSFGSAAIDSLRPQASWVFIGRRGLAPGQAIERWKNAPDSMVTLSVELPYSARSGSSSTPFIGPAKRWESVSVEGTPGEGGMTSYIVGRTSNGDQSIIDTLDTGTGRWSPADGAVDYPYVAVVSDLRYLDDEQAPLLSTVSAELAPADEWIIEPDAITISEDHVLRGDSVTATYRVRNAYRTLPSEAVDGTVHAYVAGSTDRPVVIPWVIAEPLGPDAEVERTARIPTARLGLSSVVDATVNDAARREMFSFNNRTSTSLRIREDDTPPTIEARVDGKGAVDGMYVLREPEMTIVLHDDSKLPIGDSTRLTVFVNGDRIKASNTTGFLFATTDRIGQISTDDDARAGVRFTYPLDLGQNNVIVRGFDATGNGDTIEFSVYTTDRTDLRDVTIAPDPVSTQADLLVDIITDKASVPGRIEIYGMGGERLRTILTDLVLGRTRVHWDGRDDAGAVVPIGVYHARFVANDPAGPSTRISRFVVLR